MTANEIMKRIKDDLKNTEQNIDTMIESMKDVDMDFQAMDMGELTSKDSSAGDVISKSKLLIDLMDAGLDQCQNKNGIEVCQIVESQPPVTPKPKTGHWIDDEFGSKCSCCDIYTHLDKFDRPMKFKHCSMCGAKMVETQESEEV